MPINVDVFADMILACVLMKLLGGRTARVNYPEVPRGGERTVTMAGRRRDDGTYKIYAGNLGWVCEQTR